MASTHKNVERGTATRARILVAIVDLYAREGRPATQGEISKAAPCSSGSLLHHLPIFEAEGLIVRKPGPRGIIPTRAAIDAREQTSS